MTFPPILCQTHHTSIILSVMGILAGTTGLEPATSDVTGRRSNQLNYVPAVGKNSACDEAAVRACSPTKHGGQCRARTCDLLLVRQAL